MSRPAVLLHRYVTIRKLDPLKMLFHLNFKDGNVCSVQKSCVDLRRTTADWPQNRRLHLPNCSLCCIGGRPSSPPGCTEEAVWS